MKNNLLGMLFIALGVYTLYTQTLHSASMPTGNIQAVTPKEAYRCLINHKNITVLDVRSLEEFEDDGYLSNAKLIPLKKLSKKLNKLNKNKKILVYCHSGRRSGIASKLLSEHGFRVLDVQGGMAAWIDQELPYEF